MSKVDGFNCCKCDKRVRKGDGVSGPGTSIMMGTLTILITERLAPIARPNNRQLKSIDVPQTRRLCSDCAAVAKDLFMEMFGFDFIDPRTICICDRGKMNKRGKLLILNKGNHFMDCPQWTRHTAPEAFRLLGLSGTK